jgi:AcrR family transcriptional regulator
VSVQSIYKAFGNKPALLKTVFDVAIAGDDEPVPMLQGAALSRVRAEPDPRRKLSLYGEFVAEVSPRHVPIQLLVRAAAATDAEAARVWDQLRVERMTGMTMFARALHQEGQLRPDVSVEEAGDMVWTCNSPEVYELLVVQRGWTPERYGRWVADTLTAALLP